MASQAELLLAEYQDFIGEGDGVEFAIDVHHEGDYDCPCAVTDLPLSYCTCGPDVSFSTRQVDG